MNADWERVQQIFLAALEHQPETRSAFVRARCDGSATTYREVASLLRSHERADQFIEDSPLPISAASLLNEFGELQPGEAVGLYTIVSLLGSGGMGEVYLARDDTLGREVAIKLVKRGFANVSILRQFRREERILAALNHPNIARLYGGGVTGEGLPYFVMEYVEGERLDSYCDAHRLTLSQRLELFRKVCAAVSYAHQRLVIHRDLKPANIRVTPEGEPKLLDFGIARLLEAETAANMEFTMSLQPAMTPDYASPEQTRGEPMTTATDIYSLGVVLYQLLTAEKPYGAEDRRPEDMIQAIREREPTRPSVVLRVSANSRSAIHDSRMLRGDLDNIVLVALRKEPGRRYPSVEKFSEDIRRYLAGCPILARKDTLSYRTAKFVQRNRVPVAAVVLLILSLLGGIIATTWQARTARAEKAKAESVNEFLEQMISYSNPYLDASRKDGRATTMTEILDAASRRLEQGDFARAPALKAELERIIANSYFGQGRARLANEHLKEYVSLASSLYAPGDVRSLPVAAARAGVLFSVGDFAAAERLYRQIMPRLHQAYEGKLVRATDYADALNGFAYLRRTQGDSHEAELLFREMLALSPQLPPESRFIGEIHRSTLASTLADEGKFDEAIGTAREAITDAERAGRANTPGFGFSLTVLGGFLVDEGKFSEADAVLSQAETIFRRYLSPVHLWLGDNLRNQAISLYQQGRYYEAQTKNNEALGIYRDSFGPHYDQYPTALITAGLILDKMGKRTKGEAILREALKLRTDTLPPDHFWVALARGALGECLADQERTTEAEPLLVNSYKILSQRFGSGDPRTYAARLRLIGFYEKTGNTEAAMRLRAKQ